eukprot:140449-Chlamydomonas_euryale.AAC.3
MPHMQRPQALEREKGQSESQRTHDGERTAKRRWCVVRGLCLLGTGMSHLGIPGQNFSWVRFGACLPILLADHELGHVTNLREAGVGGGLAAASEPRRCRNHQSRVLGPARLPPCVVHGSPRAAAGAGAAHRGRPPPPQAAPPLLLRGSGLATGKGTAPHFHT